MLFCEVKLTFDHQRKTNEFILESRRIFWGEFERNHFLPKYGFTNNVKL